MPGGVGQKRSRAKSFPRSAVRRCLLQLSRRAGLPSACQVEIATINNSSPTSSVLKSYGWASPQKVEQNERSRHSKPNSGRPRHALPSTRHQSEEGPQIADGWGDSSRSYDRSSRAN